MRERTVGERRGDGGGEGEVGKGRRWYVRKGVMGEVSSSVRERGSGGR